MLPNITWLFQKYPGIPPMDETMNVFVLQDDGKYDGEMVYENEMEILAKTLPGLSFNTAKIFPG